MEVVIDYTPRSWAKDFHETKKRWRVLVLHRRAGKTTGMLNHFQRDAVITPNSNYAFIAPTYKQEIRRVGYAQGNKPANPRHEIQRK